MVSLLNGGRLRHHERRPPQTVGVDLLHQRSSPLHPLHVLIQHVLKHKPTDKRTRRRFQLLTTLIYTCLQLFKNY